MRKFSPIQDGTKADQSSGEVLAIRWIDIESQGFIDLFTASLFAIEGTIEDYAHLVMSPRGKMELAYCRITIQDMTADLDYEAFPDENDEAGMFLGVLRLKFTDKTRTKLTKALWKYQGKKPFSSKSIEIIDYKWPTKKPYKRTKPKAIKKLRLMTDRPDQVKFREELMLAYGGKCCVTGCRVLVALEAAHIDQFYGKDSDHVQNGLLLRRDLHAMFDVGLLAIDPDSNTLYIAEPAQSFEEYRKISGNSRLRLPSNGGESRHPSKEALGRRWEIFKKTHLPAK